ncbi:MAG: hypothetical protein M1818_005255 [Claussenomyces sp. TS43310]|nr:MAG: hypothetical protein M1818_005255 [Claussenomyces sp. TS43310]
MVSSRKRGRQEMETAASPAVAVKELSTLERLRNMWQLANLAQWIFIFGKAVRIDEDLDIEDLEMECLKPNSTKLSGIGLALLKFVSSHRGLTSELFDEYTRRQYVAKAPERNPFGTEEEPAKFTDFDVFTKVRVLQQLTQWTMGNPDRIRERMDEQKDVDQAYWRIEPFGWDSEDRTYIVLDDNRLYRQTEPPPPPPVAAPPKKNSKKAKAAMRASKRRKLSEAVMSEDEDKIGHAHEKHDQTNEEDDGLGGMKWECLAVTLEELNSFIASIERSRDPNEKMLRKRIADDLLPLLEKQEESRRRKEAQKQRELLNLEKLATAKRSSRIAGRLEHQKQEEEAREAERKRQAETAMAKKEQEKWVKLEKERESRMMTREQRLKEREARRILHEEELAGLSEDSKKLEAGEGRVSERHLKAEIERKRQALEELALEDDWVFDCICGAYGQVDDGTHSIACEKCSVWQHTSCVGISEADAAREDFHFVCKTCKRRAEDEEKAKNRPSIKIKLNHPGSSSSLAPLVSRGHGSNTGSPASANLSSVEPILTPRASAIVQQSPSKPVDGSPYTNGGHPTFEMQAPGAADFVPLLPSDERDSAYVGQLSPQKRSFPSNGYNPHQHKAHATASPPSKNVLPSPRPYSPAILPRAYSIPNPGVTNGNSTSAVDGPAVSQSRPSSMTGSNPSPTIYSTPANRSHLHQPPSIPYNNQSQTHIEPTQRRPSMSFPSPLASAPVLKPSPSYNNPTRQRGDDPSDGSHSSPLMTSHVSGTPTHGLATPTPQSPERRVESDPDHLSALPPAFTGMSPTKHSPPRPTTANGMASLGASTPSVLPPVAPLSPNPRKQDLTPPVKSSEPERSRVISQSSGS